MAYKETEARELIISAVHRLTEAGLVARTWGNVSARVSEEQFVITPSGLGYEHMQPEDLVLVNISDLSYEGERKPSSEKGIHADAYRLRPEVNFVIHTHQDKASVYGIRGWALSGFPTPSLENGFPAPPTGFLPRISSARQWRTSFPPIHPPRPFSCAATARSVSEQTVTPLSRLPKPWKESAQSGSARYWTRNLRCTQRSAPSGPCQTTAEARAAAIN